MKQKEISVVAKLKAWVSMLGIRYEGVGQETRLRIVALRVITLVGSSALATGFFHALLNASESPAVWLIQLASSILLFSLFYSMGQRPGFAFAQFLITALSLGVLPAYVFLATRFDPRMVFFIVPISLTVLAIINTADRFLFWATIMVAVTFIMFHSYAGMYAPTMYEMMPVFLPAGVILVAALFLLIVLRDRVVGDMERRQRDLVRAKASNQDIFRYVRIGIALLVEGEDGIYLDAECSDEMEKITGVPVYNQRFDYYLRSFAAPEKLPSYLKWFAMLVNHNDFDLINEVAGMERVETVIPHPKLLNQNKILKFEFSKAETSEAHQDVKRFIVTVSDQTEIIHYAEQQVEQEKARHKESDLLSRIIQIPVDTAKMFFEDAISDLYALNSVLSKLNWDGARKALAELYNKLHAIKGNALGLKLDDLGNAVHELEDEVALALTPGRFTLTKAVFDDFILKLGLDLTDLVGRFEKANAIFGDLTAYGSVLTGSDEDDPVHHGGYITKTLERTIEVVGSDEGKDATLMAANLDLSYLTSTQRKQIRDILIQLTKNSLVHGFPEGYEGEIVIESSRVNGDLVVEYRDNGEGINIAKLREKAVELGLIDADREYSGSQLIKLIYKAGFSTNAEVGLHAGRGAGLSMVKQIADEGGMNMHLQSSSKGVRFSFTIPVEQEVTQEVTA
jgi:two-component sensor histidine kinase